MNQVPTTRRTPPPHRLTDEPLVLKRLSVESSATATAMAIANSKVTITRAAVEKVMIPPRTLPTIRVWAARPASNGPVQPKPATRYPKPKRTWFRKRSPPPVADLLRPIGATRLARREKGN